MSKRAYSGHMGLVWKIAGAALAIWVLFLAVGWIMATLKTFVIVGLIAAAVFVVISLVARRRRNRE
jgi:hypothetical protein